MYRNIRQSLQDIADLKEAEQQQKLKEQQDAAIFEQLKQDIKELCFDELAEITRAGDNLTIYYFDNKSELTANIYDNLFKRFYDYKINDDLSEYTKSEIDAANLKNLTDEQKANLTIVNKDLTGGGLTYYKIKNVFIKSPRYNADDYDKSKLLLLIDDILSQTIKETTKADAIYKKEELKEQKQSFDDLKSLILDFMIELYEEQKAIYNYNNFRFYDILSLEEARREYIEQLNLKYNVETMKAYNAALKDFKSIYCIGTRPKEQQGSKKKRGGVGIIGGAIAVFLGIIEGLEKGK